MTFVVRAALQRPSTFVVMSLLIGSARTRFDHHHTSRYFPAINIPVGSVITYIGFAGTFPGTYYLWAFVHYQAILMGIGSALGMKRAHNCTSEARSFRR